MQTISSPTPKLGTGCSGGTQVTVAPAGRPVTAQVACAAALGPVFVHVTVPSTGAPTVAVAGTLTVTVTSTTGVTISVATAPSRLAPALVVETLLLTLR